MEQGVSRFYMYRPGERAYLALGVVMSETETRLEFKTLKNDIIVVQTIGGELNRFNDQGIPAQVDVFLNGESIMTGRGHYLPLAPGVFLVIDVYSEKNQKAWPEDWGGESLRKVMEEFSDDYLFKKPYNEYINLVGVTKEGDEWAILVGLKRPFSDDVKLPETYKGFKVIVKVMGEIVPL